MGCTKSCGSQGQQKIQCGRHITKLNLDDIIFLVPFVIGSRKHIRNSPKLSVNILNDDRIGHEIPLDFKIGTCRSTIISHYSMKVLNNTYNTYELTKSVS